MGQRVHYYESKLGQLAPSLVLLSSGTELAPQVMTRNVYNMLLYAKGRYNLFTPREAEPQGILSAEAGFS